MDKTQQIKFFYIVSSILKSEKIIFDFFSILGMIQASHPKLNFNEEPGKEKSTKVIKKKKERRRVQFRYLRRKAQQRRNIIVSRNGKIMEDSSISDINSDEEIGDLENTECHFSCNPGETWD